MISEQNRNQIKTDRWYTDAGNKAAISVVSNIAVDEVGPIEDGFRWIQIRGNRMYSYYYSPNTGISAFKDFISKLDQSIRASRVPVVVSGDFNAHSPYWGSSSEDHRGELLTDMLATNNLWVCNVGDKPTFVRGGSQTHIDVTFASEVIMPNIRD